MAKKAKKLWDTHVYLQDAERKALKSIADREGRSITKQITIYIRKGLATDVK